METPEGGTETLGPCAPTAASTSRGGDKMAARRGPLSAFPARGLGPASSQLSDQSAAAVFSGRRIGAQLSRGERWEWPKGGRQNGGAACSPQRLSRSWTRTRPLDA